MDDYRLSATPIAVRSSTASPPDRLVFHDPTLYKSLVDSFQYITITRPKIASAVNSACQVMHQPTNHDFSAVEGIVRYLIFGFNHLLHAFSDSDWASDPIDRRSITENCIFLGRNPMLWTAKKKKKTFCSQIID